MNIFNNIRPGGNDVIIKYNAVSFLASNNPNKDSIIAVAGGSKKEYLEQDVSQELEKLMDDKEVYTSKENSDMAMPITKNDNNQRKYNAQIVYPIISNGDTIGTVILMSKDSNAKMNEVEKKVAQSAATFLASQMEI